MKLVQLKVEKGPKYGLKGGATLREPLVAFLGKQSPSQPGAYIEPAPAAAFFMGDGDLKRSMSPCTGYSGITVSLGANTEASVTEACDFITSNIGAYSSSVSTGDKSKGAKPSTAPPRPAFCFVGIKCGSAASTSAAATALSALTPAMLSATEPAIPASLFAPGGVSPAEAEAYAAVRDAVDKVKKACKSADSDEGCGNRPQTTSGTLLIVTAQSSISTVSALYRRRKACQNPQATLVWTNEFERQLKEAQVKSNIASIAMMTI
jgi:hypothetical protein